MYEFKSWRCWNKNYKGRVTTNTQMIIIIPVRIEQWHENSEKKSGDIARTYYIDSLGYCFRPKQINC
jgi:hypothetical protein